VLLSIAAMLIQGKFDYTDHGIRGAPRLGDKQTFSIRPLGELRARCKTITEGPAMAAVAAAMHTAHGTGRTSFEGQWPTTSKSHCGDPARAPRAADEYAGRAGNSAHHDHRARVWRATCGIASIDGEDEVPARTWYIRRFQDTVEAGLACARPCLRSQPEYPRLLSSAD
jgi:hypothetical protein